MTPLCQPSTASRQPPATASSVKQYRVAKDA